MTRLYGALLQLEDYSATGIPASIDDIARIAFAWAGVEGVTSAVEGHFSARNEGDVISERFELSETGALAWRLAFQHSDKADAAVRWRTVVTAVEGEDSRAAVELHRFSVDGKAREPLDSVDPPRLVREYLESKVVRAVDGDVDCRARHKVVSQESAQRFVEFACNEDRRLPIVLFTEGGGRGEIDYEKLQRRLAGVAHVVVLDPSASWDISHEVQPGITPWGGWTRIWWPGFSRDTSKGQAPWWNPGTTPWRLTAEIEQRVISAATQSFVGLTEFQQVRDFVRLREREQFEQAAEATRRELEAAAARAASEEVAPASQLEALQEQILLLTRQGEELNARAIAAENLHLEDLAAFEARQAELVAERDQALDRVLELEEANDAGRQRERLEESARFFRDQMAEFHGSWAEADRKRYPLGPFSFHAEFFVSVQSIAREKSKQAVEKCVHIAANRLDAVKAKEGKAPAADEQRRADGAVGMRAYLENGRPNARRILYWRLGADQGVEFVRCANHDDFALTEAEPELL